MHCIDGPRKLSKLYGIPKSLYGIPRKLLWNTKKLVWNTRKLLRNYNELAQEQVKQLFLRNCRQKPSEKSPDNGVKLVFVWSSTVTARNLEKL